MNTPGYIVFYNKFGQQICDPIYWDFSHCNPYEPQFMNPNSVSDSISGIIKAVPLDNDFYILPNPADNEVRIDYKLLYKDKVILEIYDLLGNKVLEIVNGFVDKLDNSVTFKTANLQSASYNVILITNGKRISKQFIVVH